MTSPSASQIAREVLATEAAALTRLSDELPDSFGPVVTQLLEVRGRIIVSGMGKSGHVAAKMAATFASTG